MPKLYDLKEIVETTGLPERTVRYYLSKVLEAPGGTPGRKSYYEQVTVDQLMLAQQILMRDYDPKRGEVKPTLKEFREWINSLTEEETRELVEMPYRIKPKPLSSMSVKRSSNNLFSSSKDIDYMETPSFLREQEPRSARQSPEWKLHQFGPDLEIRTRQSLTTEQSRQIQLAGELLQSVLNRE